MPDALRYVYIALALVVIVPLVIKLVRNVFTPVTTAKATVVHKQTVESFSKYSGAGKYVKYAVTFSVCGKNRSFYVSEFSYNGYRKGETGTLTYKGDRLINFR